MAVTRQQFKDLASSFVDNVFADFTHTFTIESLTETTDLQGGYTTSWATFATVTGFVQKNDGSESIQDEQIDSNYSTKFSFQYIAGLTNDMRVNYNGTYYNIKSIVSVQDKDVWIDIMADEGDAT